MNNAELIKALRQRSETKESELTFAWLYETQGAMSQAADLIEAQQKALNECAKQLADMAAKLPKEGEWLEDDTTYCGADLANYKCSLCGKIGGTWRRGLKQDKLPPYCPNCGARMKKGEQE